MTFIEMNSQELLRATIDIKYTAVISLFLSLIAIFRQGIAIILGY